MILIAKDGQGFAFQLGAREKDLLLEVLKFYPLVPASHHRLSRKRRGGQPDANQRLLDEALAEQRRDNQREIQAWLNRPEKFRATKAGIVLRVTPMEVNCLLQVLNDVRVGGWLALGQPEPGQVPKVTEENVRHFFAMEASGHFESALLAAFGVQESPQWAEE